MFWHRRRKSGWPLVGLTIWGLAVSSVALAVRPAEVVGELDKAAKP